VRQTHTDPLLRPQRGVDGRETFSYVDDRHTYLGLLRLNLEDAGGRLLVSLQGSGTLPLVLRSTTAAYQGDLGGRTGATRKCRAEFPDSHFPSTGEIRNAYGTRGVLWLSSENDRSWVDDLDLASYGIVKVFDDRHGDTYPGTPWEPKAAFTALAEYYRRR